MKLAAEPVDDLEEARWLAVVIDWTTKFLLSLSPPAFISIDSNCFCRLRFWMFAMKAGTCDSLALTVSAVELPRFWLWLRGAALYWAPG